MNKRIHNICVVIFFLTLSIPPMLNAEVWEEPKRIGSGWNTHEIAFDSLNNVYMVWWGDGISFVKSTDGGKSWSEIRNLSGVPGWASNPDIAVDSNDNLLVVFEYDVTESEEPPRRFQLFLTKNSDRGETWTLPTRIAETPKNSLWPRFIIDSNDAVHVIWHDQSWGHNEPHPDHNVEFYHIRSLDGGTTWSNPNEIARGEGAWTLDAAVDSENNIYAFWSFTPETGDGGVLCYKSMDGGATWTSSRLGWGGSTTAAIDSNDVTHAVWEQGIGDNESLLFYQRTRVLRMV